MHALTSLTEMNSRLLESLIYFLVCKLENNYFPVYHVKRVTE